MNLYRILRLLPVCLFFAFKKKKKNQLPNRLSYEGQIHIDASTGLPLNPRGRTGMTGRGLLYNWGPNHAADPIVTRINPETKKLEFVAIQRKDTGLL